MEQKHPVAPPQGDLKTGLKRPQWSGASTVSHRSDPAADLRRRPRRRHRCNYQLLVLAITGEIFVWGLGN